MGYKKDVSKCIGEAFGEADVAQFHSGRNFIAVAKKKTN
jgi:hypothetical protein